MSRILLVVAVATAISGCASKSPPTTVSQTPAPQPAAAVGSATTPQAAVRTAYVVEAPSVVVPAPYGLEYFGAPRDSMRAHCIRKGGVWRASVRQCETAAP